MTIAACFVSPEGVVLGADSATTFGSRNHFFHGQKVFEVGRKGESTLGLTMWGLGSFGESSYRTLIARFSDEVAGDTGTPVEDHATRWRELFWEAYQAAFVAEIARVQELKARPGLTDLEREELDELVAGYSGGFCLGGYAHPDCVPRAFAFSYSPDEDFPTDLDTIQTGTPQFWGQPNFLQRLTLGIDVRTFSAILSATKDDGSARWNGTWEDLASIVIENKLSEPSKHLPIREAIDWVYSSIYTTIKAIKFANLPPVCGGPIEIAVLTSDRPYRWVRHKEFDAAIGYHSP